MLRPDPPKSGAIIAFSATRSLLRLAASEEQLGRLQVLGGSHLQRIAEVEGVSIKSIDLGAARRHLASHGALATFPELHPPPLRDWLDIEHSDRIQRYPLIEALLSRRHGCLLHVAEPEGGETMQLNVVFRTLEVTACGDDPVALQRALVSRLDSIWDGKSWGRPLAAARLNTPEGRRAAIRQRLRLHSSALRRRLEADPSTADAILYDLQRITEVERAL